MKRATKKITMKSLISLSVSSISLMKKDVYEKSLSQVKILIHKKRVDMAAMTLLLSFEGKLICVIPDKTITTVEKY